MVDEFRLEIVDLAPVVDALGRILPKESDLEAALGAIGVAGRADFRGGRANTRWQAVLEQRSTRTTR